MNSRLYRILRPIAVLLFKAIYRIKVINKKYIPKDGPIIFVGNHKHNYDCISLMCGTKRTIHFMAKKELMDKHGWFFNRVGIIPVDRSVKNSDAMASAIELLKSGEVIGVFPEGTFNKTEYVVMPFKYGAVRIACDANATIIPFAITGEYRKFRSGLKIEFGEPYKIMDKKDLTKENIKLMNKVIKLMKGKDKKHGEKKQVTGGKL